MPRSSIATDSFTYSDGRLSTVASANWADLDGGMSYASIVSNAVKCPYPNPAPARWVGSGTWTADQYAKVKVPLVSVTSGIAGVIVRASADTGAGRDYYYAVVDCYGTGNPNTVIGKVINGTLTEISRVSGDGWVSGDTISMEVEGSTLRVYRNDVQLTSAGRDALTDTDIAGSAAHHGGIVIYDNGNALSLDDWEGGNIVAASKQLVVKFVDGAGADAANLSGLKAYVWDTATLSDLSTTTPAYYTATATTSAAGVMTLTPTGITTAAGSNVMLLVTNSDGTTTQSPPEIAFFGPVQVTTG